VGGSAAWRHRHLLDVDGLDRADLETVMATADGLGDDSAGTRTPLQGVRVATLFYEPSTRTRLSFELAARALGAIVVDLPVPSSSVTKGESLVDTVRTLEALGVGILVMRHPRSGAPWLAARIFGGHVINAGDGWHAHPTQALLDLYTLRQRLVRGVDGARVTIVGDVLHSRVARSDIWALTAAGARVTLCGPASWLRGFEAWAAALPPERSLIVTPDLRTAVRGADVVMALRVQRERLSGASPITERAYAAQYGLTSERLRDASPEVVVLHPGPMNEGVEIASEVATGPASAITRQVSNGLVIRSAVLSLLAGTGLSPSDARP
jgi:aspartate carbamoyltransferase catalytic subunit